MNAAETAVGLNRTVDSHRYQISLGLGLHDVASMVRYAIRHDLVRPDA